MDFSTLSKSKHIYLKNKSKYKNILNRTPLSLKTENTQGFDNFDPKKINQEENLKIDKQTTFENENQFGNYMTPNTINNKINIVTNKDIVFDENKNFKNEDQHERKKLSKLPMNMISEMVTTWEPSNPLKINETYELIKGAKVNIFYDKIKKISLYTLSEPIMSEVEKEELEEIKKHFKYLFEITQEKEGVEKKEKMIEKSCVYIMKRKNIELTEQKLEKFLYYLVRDFLGFEEIEPLFHDKNIEDISCDGLGVPVYINHMKYGPLEVNIVYNDKKKLDSFIVKMAQKAKKEITLSKPILQGKLPDGSRIEAIYGEEISQKGSTFTIRKFREVPYTPIHLLKNGTIPSILLAYLWLALENKKSIIVSGGTATGKTTILNALSLFVPPSAKIVSIEDTPEINLPHKHWLAMSSRETGNSSDITMFELLKATLRERPDYIIVGEIRGEEANVLFQGISTGHSGMGTVHAENFESFVNRMTTRPINLSKSLLSEANIVIFLKQLTIKENLVRRVTSVTEIDKFIPKEDRYVLNEFIKFNQTKDSFQLSNSSIILNKLIEQKGGTEKNILTELEKRKRILEVMSERNILEFKEVSKIMKVYYQGTENIFNYIENL
jgi:flagellar protein FlaI